MALVRHLQPFQPAERFCRRAVGFLLVRLRHAHLPCRDAKKVQCVTSTNRRTESHGGVFQCPDRAHDGHRPVALPKRLRHHQGVFPRHATLHLGLPQQGSASRPDEEPLAKLSGPPTTDGLTTVALLYEAIYEERLDDALRLLQTFLSTVPYCDRTDYEGHYQQMLYIIFSLLGAYVDVEVRTPRGRVDMVMRTATTLYIVELKLNQSAKAAMQQIDLKNYPERFALCGLPVVKVGINFDMERHTLKDWMITR